jgi:hypothetical protein
VQHVQLVFNQPCLVVSRDERGDRCRRNDFRPSAGRFANRWRATRLEAIQRKETTMQFLLFICNDPTGEEYAPEDDDIETWLAAAEGVRREGNRLRPQSEAKTVRRRKGKVLVTDGPFADTKERIGGFDLLECDDIETAIDIASKHPMARFGCVEVRPIWPFE